MLENGNGLLELSDVPISLMLGTSSNYGSPNGSGPDLDGMGHRSIYAQIKELRDILLPLARGFAKFVNHVKTLRPSMLSLPRWRRLQHWNRASALSQKMSTLSLHAYARLKRMQRPSPAVPTRQDHGTYLVIVTAPQPLGPLGPMAQGHLLTVETRGVDLILSPVPKMNRHEVPSYFGSHAECHGSPPLRRCTCWANHRTVSRRGALHHRRQVSSNLPTWHHVTPSQKRRFHRSRELSLTRQRQLTLGWHVRL